MYYQYQLDDYINLVNKFLFTCKYDGTFQHKPVPKKLRIKTSMMKKRKLKKCMKYINTTDWFTSCKFICENMNISKWNKFFIPKLIKIMNYTSRIEKKVYEWDKLEEDYYFYLKIKNIDKPKEMRRLRVLEEKADPE